MTTDVPNPSKDVVTYHVVFFCPGCRRRLAFWRMTPFGWHLNDFCSLTLKRTRMRRSKNQDFATAEKAHGRR